MTPCILVNTNISKEINARGSFLQYVGTHLANYKGVTCHKASQIVKSINIGY